MGPLMSHLVLMSVVVVSICDGSHLVNGTRDETLNILPSFEDLWERTTEGRCGLDGWEADFPFKKRQWNPLGTPFHLDRWKFCSGIRFFLPMQSLSENPKMPLT